jgi:uncharacterized membrane protein (DUF4010 family)
VEQLTTDLAEVFVQLGIALGLGLLVGLQRERTRRDIAGFRTFPLATLLGSLCALLSGPYGGWVLAAGIVSLAGMVLVGNLAKMHSGDPQPGITTEVALLVMFGVGAIVVVGPPTVAIAVGGVTAALLYYKRELHGFAYRIGEEDFRAVIQFALLTLVILPVLPNETYGPYDVLNPREIWLMVVLIVGISLAGYVGLKLLGPRVGILLGGMLGGVVSSTATTVSYARRSVTGICGPRLATLIILIASAMVYVRVLVQVAVVAPAFLPWLAGPVAVVLLFLLVFTGLAWSRGDADAETDLPEQHNPSELRTALLFGALYGIVILAVEWARVRLGSGGLYSVAILSGLIDMNAITLSTAQLVSRGTLPAGTGWRLILLASLSNLIFKSVVIGLMGSRALLRSILLWWGLAILGGLAILALWPW